MALIHPVKPGRDEPLWQALQRLDHEAIAAMQRDLPVGAVQWVMFDNGTRLLCAMHFCGTVDTLFRAFATHRADRCKQIWGHCIGYPDGPAHTSADVAAYLAAGQVPITTYFPTG